METYLFLFNFTAFILFFSRITSSSLEIYNYIGNDSEHRVGWLYTKQYKKRKKSEQKNAWQLNSESELKLLL